MTEPVTLADLKGHLRLDLGISDEDAMLTGMIVAARRACEYAINRSIVGASLTQALDAFPALPCAVIDGEPVSAVATSWEDLVIELDGGQVVAVAISYIDPDGQVQTVAPTAFTVDLSDQPARLAPVGAWPVAAEQPGAVRIAYTVSPLGADDWQVVGQAMKLICGHWYVNRESVVDVRGTAVELPQSATWLLQPLRQWATD